MQFETDDEAKCKAHRKLKSEDYEKSEATGKEYESILEKETYHQSRSEYCLYCFEHAFLLL